ncbi:MAG: deoxyribonuclease IV [Desulfurella sp.]|uniref:Endonuclease IV n=3 Tax=Desulfurella TaxID=33001 RepID=A0A1G6MBC7_9BACT|nr:deoxyribonuclease IV [Desulfurella multipotens]SDC52286.1 Endonuclease IV [Desulfurella multipotens]
MKLGIHLSIEHSIIQLPILCKTYKLDCFQFFTKSPRRWSEKLIDDETANAFKQNISLYNINPENAFIHCSYLINPANPTSQTYNELETEFENAYKLGIYNLVLHPGSCKDPDCLQKVTQTIKPILSQFSNTTLLLENTTRIGKNLQDLKILKEKIGENVFFCIDTCHLFATGYNLDVEELDNILDINNIKLWHLNDSKAPFGSNLDRHEKLGKGLIGFENIKTFLRSKKLKNASFILETPGTNKTRFKEVELLRKFL